MALRDPIFATPVATPDQIGALEASGMSSLRRGYEAGRIGTDINALAAQEASLRRAAEAGDAQALAQADALRSNITGLQQRQGMYAPQVGRLEDIHGLSDAGSWAAGQIGQGVASMQDPLAAGVALQGAGTLLSNGPGAFKLAGTALRGAGLAVPYLMNQRQMAGEAYNAMVQDPELMARTSAADRELNANLYGAAAGVLDTAVPGMIAGKLTGAGLRQGLAGVRRAGLGTRTLGGMAMEGGTEALQQIGQQQTLGYMNPNRDTSGDFMENVNAFAGGAIGAGPMVTAGEMADSGYNRVGRTADAVKEKAGQTVDLLSPYAQKAADAAAPVVESVKGKVVDLFAGEDGKITPKSVIDNLTTKAKEKYADFDQKMQERELISGDAGFEPGSAEYDSWYAENSGKRTQAISDKLAALAESGDETAAKLYQDLGSDDDATYTNAIEAGADHILSTDEWGKFNDEVERRAAQASRLSTKFGKLAGEVGRRVGGAAVDFGKAVIDGAKSGAKKNMQGESLVGQGAVYDPEAMRLRDVAIDKEAERWDQGKQRSFRRAQLMSEYLAEELKTARAMPGARMPSGSPEAMTGFAKDLGLEIADLAENWGNAPKSKGSNPNLSGPASIVKSGTDSRGQQFDGLTYNLNRIVRSLKMMYGEQAESKIAELQNIAHDANPALFDYMRDELEIQNSRKAGAHNAKVEAEARNAVVNSLGDEIESALVEQGVNIRTEAGKQQLFKMVEAIDNGTAPGAAVKAMTQLVGKDALLRMRQTIRPKQASREDLIDDGGVVNDEGVTVNDDGEVHVAETSKIDKAYGDLVLEKMGAKRMIGFRGTQRVRLEGGDKKDVFAPSGKISAEERRKFEDEYRQRMAEGGSFKMPAAMQRPRLAFRGDTFTGGEDAVEGSRVRFEKRIGADYTPENMIKTLRAEGNNRGADLAESMIGEGHDLTARARAFFENRSEGGKWEVKSVSVKDYLDEEGADPLRRVSLYRDYLRQDAANENLTPAERKNLMARVRNLGSVIGDVLGQQKGNTSGLRMSPSDRKRAVAAANDYFADRFINVADQITNAVPEQISAGEIDAMAEMGKRMFDSARKGRGENEYNYPALSKKNIIVFQRDEKGKDGKPTLVPIPANRLAAWGNLQLAMMEGTKEQGNKAESTDTHSNTDKDMEFLRGLTVGIQAIMSSGVVASKLPYKINAAGYKEKFEKTGELKSKTLTDADGSNPRTVKVPGTGPRGALAVLDGLPDSLELKTTNVFGLKKKIEAGSERYRKKILPELEKYQAENSMRIAAQNDAQKLKEWSNEPFVSKQDEDELPPSDVWGTLSHHAEAAKAKGVRGDQSMGRVGATQVNPSTGKVQTNEAFTDAIGAASRPKAYVEGQVDPITGRPEFRGRTNLAGPKNDRMSGTYKTTATGGWNEKGTQYEYGPTPSDFGDAPEGFEDVKDRTKAQGRSALQRSKGELGPEVPMTASKMAESRAETIRKELDDNPERAIALIERRLRQAEQPRWGVGRNEVVGGAQYAIPVIKALDDATLEKFDADGELAAYRDKAIELVRNSDLNKTLKEEFAPAAKEVGASLGKPSGVGKVKLTGTSVYLAKDQAKSDRANKFIGRGSASSSTAQYAKDWGNRANTGSYTSSDVVFVSAEGNRSGRVPPDLSELNKAMAAGATLITDTEANRERPYNVGEREVTSHLKKHGYVESKPGTWTAGARLYSRTEDIGDAVAGELMDTSTPAFAVAQQALDAFKKLYSGGMSARDALAHADVMNQIAMLSSMKLQGFEHASRAYSAFANRVDQVTSLRSDRDTTAAINSRLAQGSATLSDMMKEIIVSDLPEQFKAIARAVKTVAGSVPVELGALNSGGDGEFLLGAGKITMLPNLPGATSVVLHEGVHAATAAAVLKDGELHKALYDLMDHVAKHDSKLVTAYGMKNTLEFLAEGLSNERFQKKLMRIPASKTVEKYLGQTLANAWDAFVGLVRQALGLKAGQENALSQLLELSGRAMRNVKTDGVVSSRTDSENAALRQFKSSHEISLAIDAVSQHAKVADYMRKPTQRRLITEVLNFGDNTHVASVFLATVKGALDRGYAVTDGVKMDRLVGAAANAAASYGMPSKVEDIGTKFNRQSRDIHADLGREGFAATHDSPIRHEGKFDWRAHQGKGEGNAAFGAGTYLSTADGVHESYKEMFTAIAAKVTPLTASHMLEQLRILRSGDKHAIAKYFDADVSEVTPDGVAEATANAQEKIAPTYEVSVNIKPEQLLDWDKPLSEQSELVQKALANSSLVKLRPYKRGDTGETWYSAGIISPHDPNAFNGAGAGPTEEAAREAARKHFTERTGMQAYVTLTKLLGSQAKASDYLQSLGILGHRYAAVGGTNDQHPNYVIYDDSKITTNYVHFNKQGASKASTQAERDAAVAEVVKTLGKDIDVRFEQTTGFSGAYLDKEAAIVISLTPAAGTLQTAYHEALHAFVARLVKGNDRAMEVLDALANHQPTIERVHALLAEHPAAQAQLTDGEERIAYIYQFWRAGLLDLPVSPARTLLQKVAKFFRQVLGRVSDLERSTDLLGAFARGSFAGEPSAAGKVLAKELNKGVWAPRILRKADALVQKIAALTVPAHSLLAMSESKTAQKLGEMFWTNPGEEEAGQQKEGYLNARERMAKRYTNEFSRIVGDLSERDHKAVLDYLQAEADPATIPYAPHREAVEKIRALLQRFRTYMVEERGHKVGDMGPLYFPRVWSAEALLRKKSEFMDMMAKNHPTEDAEMVWDALSQRYGTDDAAHGPDAPGMDDKADLSPTQSAKHGRVFPFITGEQAEPFLDKSLVGTMTRYFHDGARAAEYTHRFGRKGEKLAKAMDMIEIELDKAARAKIKTGELKDEDAAIKWSARQMRDVSNSIKAMEGTLGRDISDSWRATNSWVTVYQNVRLLPLALFSSVVDPLGMVARGATMREAYDGFLRGMSEVVREWGSLFTGERKERSMDKWERLAAAVGSVDAAVWNHHVSDEYASVFMSAGAKKINDFMFKANGMEAWNRGMRVAATRSAVLFIQRHKSLPDTHSARWLKELGLTPADVHLDADGQLITDKHTLAAQLGIDKVDAAKQVEKIHIAINRWVQGSILTPNAAQRPAWGSDPHFSMFFHLKQFSYSFHQTLIKRAVKEMEYGNLAPLGAFIWYIPVMIAADISKGLIQGGGDLPAHMKGMDLGDWIGYAAGRSGVLGLGQMGVDASGDLSSVGGPAVEQIIDAFSDPLERTAIKAAPAHGLYAEMFK